MDWKEALMEDLSENAEQSENDDNYLNEEPQEAVVVNNTRRFTNIPTAQQNRYFGKSKGKTYWANGNSHQSKNWSSDNTQTQNDESVKKTNENDNKSNNNTQTQKIINPKDIENIGKNIKSAFIKYVRYLQLSLNEEENEDEKDLLKDINDYIALARAGFKSKKYDLPPITVLGDFEKTYMNSLVIARTIDANIRSSNESIESYIRYNTWIKYKNKFHKLYFSLIDLSAEYYRILYQNYRNLEDRDVKKVIPNSVNIFGEQLVDFAQGETITKKLVEKHQFLETKEGLK